jgi:dihydrofolate reductase
MRVTLYMTMTVNGYIARSDGTTPWSDAAWQSYQSMVQEYKTMIIGSSTYKLVTPEEIEKLGDPAVVVLTHTAKSDEGPVSFATSAQEALAKIEARGFTKALVDGGAQCNAAFLKAGLVDEVILDIEPIMFGSGIPLFSQCALDVPLKLLETRKLTENLLQVRYQVVKENL